MRNLIFALAATMAAVTLVGERSAKATDATTCGYVQGPGGWYKLSDRSGPYSIDGSCTATLLGSGGGGGGGPATIADGADAAEGATTDPAYTTGAGTTIGLLKGLFAKLATIATNTTSIATSALQTTGNTSLATIATNTTNAATTTNQTSVQSAPGTPQTIAVTVQGNASGVAVPVSNATGATSANQTTANASLATIVTNTTAPTAQGVTASGASLTENPLANGGRAATTEPTAVADGQKVAMMMTKSGKPIVIPYAPVELWNDSGGTDGSGSAAAITVLAASGSASLKEYLKSVHCGRDDAGTAAIRVTITEGTKTRYLTLPNSGGGGGNNATYDPPIPFAANTAVTATPSASVTGNINCDAQGYNAP